MKFRIRLILAFLFALIVPVSNVRADSAEDFAIPGGHVYLQGGGYIVSDENGIAMLREYRRLGGADVLGYPISGRFSIGGTVFQATQKALLQWRSAEQKVVPANVLDDLSQLGRDDWLLSFRQTPKQLSPTTAVGTTWDETVVLRQALLDVEPAIRSKYFSAPDPLGSYGLPTSAAQDMGNHVAIRFQRAVMQRWKIDVPWARAGEVTTANAGEIARDGGLIPTSALRTSIPIVEGRAERTPWSGWWWPVDAGVPGPHLFDDDGPLARHDELARIRGSVGPRTRDWELANLRLTGGQYLWAGHCNGWAAAAILESEPAAPRTIDGVTFSIADQKGLLSSWHFADSAEWNFGDDEIGVNPADFHRALIQWLGEGRRSFIINAANRVDQVFNFPAYRFRLVYLADEKDPAVTHVRANVWFVDYNVNPNFVGMKNWPSDEGRLFEYTIVGDRKNPTTGGWEGVSASGDRFSHPWRVWYPNALNRNTTRPLVSPNLDYQLIQTITGRRAR